MAADGNGSSYALGVDLGTTTVKVALVDVRTKNVVQTKSRETHATLMSELGTAGNEQDAGKILTALQFCLSGLPKDALTRVVKIGVSGQMHGVMLWKSGRAWIRNSFGRLDVDVASHLFTWQDGRCKGEFLDSLPLPRSHIKLATGLGCVTLLWLQRHQPAFVAGYDCAGTVQDFVVSVLCALQRPAMSVQNATSWGYFDTIDKSWNVDILSGVDFPIHLLPPVHDVGTIAGHTGACWYGIPEGTSVSVAMGDLQCSTLARLQQPEDAVLNISTSAQLAIRMNPNFVPPKMDVTSSIEYFPYFTGHYLAVAASLTGGNVMFAFVKMLQQWTHELGLGVPKTKIWEVLQDIGPQDCGATDLNILPMIYGERHNPSQKASVTNITPLNTNLGSVYHALCRGIITNLHNMMSQNFLLAAGVKRIVGSGTAVLKNSILSTEIRALYKLPLVLSEGSDADAAVGAALAVLLWRCDSSQ